MQVAKILLWSGREYKNEFKPCKIIIMNAPKHHEVNFSFAHKHFLVISIQILIGSNELSLLLEILSDIS